MEIKLLIAAGLIVLCGPASAQSCGGMVNVNGVCIPPDQGSSPLNDSYGDQGGYNAPAMPQMIWADSWGAIAGDGTGYFGIVTDLPSKRKARKAAVEECHRRGGGDCKANRIFVNQCAAVIAGPELAYSANAPTVERAIELGNSLCNKDGSTNCRVYWSGCSLAKRIQ